MHLAVPRKKNALCPFWLSANVCTPAFRLISALVPVIPVTAEFAPPRSHGESSVADFHC
jgi:hypothetical protein